MSARVGLALELPTLALEAVSPLADLDFVLSYRVLQDEAYAAYYARPRPAGRELILDNGLFELGVAADWPELMDAAGRVKPDFIICPDQLNDGRFNLEQLERAVLIYGAQPEKLGVVITGRDADERARLVNAALSMNVGLLCFPHTETRLEWYVDLEMTFGIEFAARRLHLLGFIDFDELHAWRRVGLPRLSMDTSKIAKLALAGRWIDDGQPLRGLMASKLVFDLKLTPRQIELCQHNVRILKEHCSDGYLPINRVQR